MLNCVICDDDVLAVREARAILEAALQENGCGGRITEYTDARVLLYDVQEYKPIDLVILDIEMPYVSGMELAAEIKERFPDCCIIFLTQHAQYAIEAYELNIFRYTPKSQMHIKLGGYIADALRLIALQDGMVYTVTAGEHWERLPYAQMLCVKKDGKYAVITCLDGREIRIRKTLQSVCAELDENEFLRIDRGLVVNIATIQRISGGEIVCKGDRRFPVSRLRLNAVKAKVTLYWGKRI